MMGGGIKTPDEFQAARKRLGVTQKELADVWGVDPRSIRRWESGEVRLSPLAAYTLGIMIDGACDGV